MSVYLIMLEHQSYGLMLMMKLIKVCSQRRSLNMTVKELISILNSLDSEMEIFIEGRDSSGEYCDADEMTEKHIHIGDGHIVIVAE